MQAVEMQSHGAETHLPTDGSAKTLVQHIRELVEQIIEESRNAIRGPRTFAEERYDLIQNLSRVPQKLVGPGAIGFRLIVEGIVRPLRQEIRDEIYLIGREGLANALRHSGAKEIEAELIYAPDYFRMFIRDNGCGIDPKALTLDCGRHLGLSCMRDLALRMGAKFKVLSRAAIGTEIKLSVPGRIAFEPQFSDHPAAWASQPYSEQRNA